MAPVQDGQVLNPEQFNALPLKTRKAILAEMKAAQARLEEALKSTPEWKTLQAQKVAALQYHLTERIVDEHFKKLIKNYGDQESVLAYLNAAKEYLLENLNF